MPRSHTQVQKRGRPRGRSTDRHVRLDAPLRRIVIAAFPDVQVLDVTGPLEVFGRTARLLVE
jgi:hypothetical protein